MARQGEQFGLSLEEQIAARGQQAGQFEKGLGLDYQTLEAQRAAQRAQQRQFAASQDLQREFAADDLALREAGITGTYEDQQTMAGQRAQLERQMLEEQVGFRDPMAQLIAAREAGFDVGGLDVEKAFRDQYGDRFVGTQTDETGRYPSGDAGDVSTALQGVINRYRGTVQNRIDSGAIYVDQNGQIRDSVTNEITRGY